MPFNNPINVTRSYSTMKTRLVFLITLLCAAVASLQTVHASIITVMNTNDSGAGSLRAALAAAADGDTINFDPSVNGQTITLTSGQLSVNHSIAITGPGADMLAVDGNHASRVFYIASGKTVTISGLTVTNGNAVSGYGGGIYNDHATLTVSNSTLRGSSGYGGGGIVNDAFQGSATLTITNSTLRDNSAGNGGGGGILNHFSGNPTLTIANSTLSGNSTTGNGGGIFNDGEAGRSTVTITNSTLSGNSASTGGGISNLGDSGIATLAITNTTLSGNSATGGFGGGGIYNEANASVTAGSTAVLAIAYTILNAGSSGENIVNSNSGLVISLGYNLSSDNAGGLLTGTFDQVNADPLLGPLQNNGGPTFTHELLTGSPAIDAGPLFDERGPNYLRVVNGRIDIGAFEVQAPTPAAPVALDYSHETASSFTANWSTVSGATGYRLDVSTSSNFATYVPGYQNLDVGNVTSQSVTGLAANTFYYYRVRAYNVNSTSPNSNVIRAKTKNS